MLKQNTFPISITKIVEEAQVKKQDLVAVEEPLEIKLAFGPIDNKNYQSLAITMRTPGNDPELALGFLFSEGLIQSCCRTCYRNLDPFILLLAILLLSLKNSKKYVARVYQLLVKVP